MSKTIDVVVEFFWSIEVTLLLSGFVRVVGLFNASMMIQTGTIN